jgi:hypothetical protein
LEIVSATRLDGPAFEREAPLGQSLSRLRAGSRIKAHIFANNTAPLPAIYNQRIRAGAGPDAIVFVHDDVWLEDHFFVDRILEGLAHFDVIGVAGNRRRLPHQPAWHMLADGSIDRDHLSGAIGQARPFGTVAQYGPSGLACELLDGVLLAARRSTLWRNGIHFDPIFDFHFYDMDFCRTARRQQMRLGTWPVVIGHRSGGNFASEEWKRARERYLAKWTD